MNIELFTAPGEYILEILESRDMTQKELALRLEISEKHMSNIINSKSELTYNIANKLSIVFPDTTASFWNNVEAKYRESIETRSWLANLDDDKLIEYSKRFRFSEVIRGRKPIKEKAYEVLKLLNIVSFENFENVFSEYSMVFHKDKGSVESMVLWMKLSEKNILSQNEFISKDKFDQKKIIENLPKIKRYLMIDNKDIMIRRVRKLLNSCGVYFTVTSNITKSSIRGALSTYYGVPVIHSTFRFKTHDNFCFSLMHEIAHLVLHEIKPHIEYIKGDNINSLDVEANEFARDFLISPDNYKDFIQIGNFTQQDIELFAEVNNVLPGIVLGRLQHDGYVPKNTMNHIKVSFK